MSRPSTLIPVGADVRDRWWPHRLGVVIKQSKTRTHVAWSDGEVWRYDAAHRRFLEKIDPRAERRHSFLWRQQPSGVNNQRKAKRNRT